MKKNSPPKSRKKAPPGYVNPHAETNLQDLPRLQRLIGQLEGVRRMIEEKRHCYEIVHQLRAVESAIRGLEAKILENHLEHLIEEVLSGDPADWHGKKKSDLFQLLRGKLQIV